MRTFTAAELAAMRRVQVDSMSDACVLLTPSAQVDAYGKIVSTYTASAETGCGFEPASSQRGGTLAGVLVQLSARLRLPLDAPTVAPDAVVKLTKRAGEILATPEYYQVQGWPQRGMTAQVLMLDRIERPAGAP